MNPFGENTKHGSRHPASYRNPNDPTPYPDFLAQRASKPNAAPKNYQQCRQFKNVHLGYFTGSL
jgi:hypothetical protein